MNNDIFINEINTKGFKSKVDVPIAGPYNQNFDIKSPFKQQIALKQNSGNSKILKPFHKIQITKTQSDISSDKKATLTPIKIAPEDFTVSRRNGKKNLIMSQ